MSECQHGTFAANCADCWKERAEEAEADLKIVVENSSSLTKEQEIGLRVQLKAAKAAAAEMRWMCSTLLALVPEKPKAITWERGVEIINHCQDNRDKLARGSSSDCGKGWVSPEMHGALCVKFKELEDKLSALEAKYAAALEDWHRSDTKLAAAVEALKELNLLQLNWGDTSHTFESSCKIARETLAKIKE